MWNEVAEKVRKRDKYTCYKCNVKDNSIDVHHILPKHFLISSKLPYQKYGISNEFDMNNLICLCGSCHKRADNNFLNLGITNYTRQMLATAKIRTMRTARGVKC